MLPFRFERSGQGNSEYHYIIDTSSRKYLSIVTNNGRVSARALNIFSPIVILLDHNQSTEDEKLWKIIETPEKGTYHIVNKATNTYLIPADWDGSYYDVHHFGAYPNFVPDFSRWRLHKMTQGQIDFNSDSHIELYDVKLGEVSLNNSHLKTTTNTIVDNYSNESGVAVSTAESNHTQTTTLETSQTLSSAVSSSHTVSASIAFKSDFLIAKSTKTFGYEYSHQQTHTTTNGTSQGATTSSTEKVSAQVRQNYAPGGGLEIITSYRELLTDVPYSATAVRIHSDGYREPEQEIQGSIKQVLYGDYEFKLIDRFASVKYPHYLDLDIAIVKNNWATADQVQPWSSDTRRNHIIHNLSLVTNNSVSELQSFDNNKLVESAMIYFWAKKTGVLNLGITKQLKVDEIFNRLKAYISMHSEYDIRQSGHLETYPILQRVLEVSRAQASLTKFVLTKSKFKLDDTLYLLGIASIASLEQLNANDTRNAAINSLYDRSSSSISQLQSKTDEELVAHLLMYQALKDYGINPDTLKNTSLDDQRNTSLFWLTLLRYNKNRQGVKLWNREN